ncbi:MAG: hypothetical protein SGI84_08710, partial [Gemmatimonadota bacterium]|nr:hypothetical protein [Gemmatimonadota bacterium]
WGSWVAGIALALNAVFMGVAGLVAGRPSLLVGAAVAALGAIGVAVAWRRHQRTLASLHQGRLAMREEATALRNLIRRPE